MVANKKRQKSTSLVLKKLERVSKEVFKQHYELITELVGNSPGIYALYDENDLYYVGKSIDLKKRVKQHLKDRHLASWSHFSLYLARDEDHIHEIESLLIRVANPKGNRNVPKGKSSGQMLTQLQQMVKQKQKSDYDKMFGIPPMGAKKKIEAISRNIEGLVSNRTQIYRSYKGKEHKAYLYPDGTIRLGNASYTSPSGAAQSVVGRGAVNGWHFWYIKDSVGDWVRLSQFAK